jgi:uncharacterized RDD family membrane protein YckC
MASWGYRVGGFVVDIAFVVLAGLAVGYLAKAAGDTNDGANALGGLTGIAAWFTSTVLIFGRTRGRSIGKLMAGTRVVRENGKPARYLTGFVRETLCRLLYFVPFFGLIDIFMPLGYDHQSLRDKMLHTRVLREPEYEARRWPLTAAAVVLTAGWIGVTAAAGAYKDAGGYQAIDRDAFISGCKSQGGSEDACGCAFDYIKARVPYSRTSNTDEWPPRVRRIVVDAFTSCGA